MVPEAQTFSLRNRYGLAFFGSLYKADAAQGFAIVLHGFSGSASQPHIQEIIKVYQDNGYAVLALDVTNASNKADGSTENATLEHHLHDLEDAVSWAQTQPWYREPFALAGHSLGGYCCLLFAEGNGEKIKSLFLAAPVINGTLRQASFEEFMPDAFRLFQERGFIESKSARQGQPPSRRTWKYFQSLFHFDSLADAAKLSMPVLIVVGDKDTSCPPKHQQILLDAIPSPRKEMRVIQGANHNYDGKLDELGECLKVWL